MTAQQVITLFGRQGHGKLTMINKVTGSRFLVSSGARSYTTHLQFKKTLRHGILCVDTPGFHASQDVAQHVACQKIALEDVSLSGVYVVVKHARADDISEMLGNVMDFLGEDVQIIVAHEDVAVYGEGYDRDDPSRCLRQGWESPRTESLPSATKPPRARLSTLSCLPCTSLDTSRSTLASSRVLRLSVSFRGR